MPRSCDDSSPEDDLIHTARRPRPAAGANVNERDSPRRGNVARRVSSGATEELRPGSRPRLVANPISDATIASSKARQSAGWIPRYSRNRCSRGWGAAEPLARRSSSARRTLGNAGQPGRDSASAATSDSRAPAGRRSSQRIRSEILKSAAPPPHYGLLVPRCCDDVDGRTPPRRRRCRGEEGSRVPGLE